MPVLLFYLLIGEPVAEITLVEGVSLGVDAFVIERMLTGREDALYLVGQPATVTGRVAQKLGIVARAAEGVDMLALLGIMAYAALSLVYCIVTTAFSWFSSDGLIVSSSS